MQNNYNILINKLDAFIRKYYKNLVIRGSLYSVGSILLLYLFITLVEHFAHSGTYLRALLFFSFIIFNTVVILRLIIWPLLKTFRLGSVISHEKAAQIIGAHFPEVEDKLINVLQLKKMADHNDQTRALIEAGIEQKADLISPVPFKNAIDFKQNKKYLKFAVPPLLMLLLILLTSPGVITDSTKRIVHYQNTFERPAPFEFIILNEDLSSVQNKDLTLQVQTKGRELPAEVFIHINNNSFLLNKTSPSLHQYTFRNIQRNQQFWLSAAGYKSKAYEIKVWPKPTILHFDIELKYPAYTGKRNETQSNAGDIVVPQGTRAKWVFNTRETKNIHFLLNDSLHLLEAERQNHFSVEQRLMHDKTYSLFPENEFVMDTNAMTFTINVIPDAYPSIDVEVFQDSVYDKNLFFTGMIEDDYGFSHLNFRYRINRAGQREAEVPYENDLIEIDRNVRQQRFYYHFNLSQLPLEPGDEVSYFFEVWDNDAVNGSKSTKTPTFTYRTLTKREVQDRAQEQTRQLHRQMETAMRDARSIQQTIDDLNRRILEQKSLNWQDRKNIEELIQRAQELQKNTEQIQQQFENKEEWANQYHELNEDLMRKQEELNRLLEELMTDEMKALLQELEEMLDNLDRSKVKDMLDKMKFDMQDVETQIDRSLELMKQFEVEKMMTDAIEKLKSLAKEQQELAEQSQQRGADNEAILEEQQKLNEAFEDIQEQLDEMHQKNSALERPNKIEPTDAEQKAIEESMEESSRQLQRNNPRRASGSQQDASEQMQKLSEQLQQMHSQMMQDNLAEDAHALRMILENLLRTSFAQEDLMLALRHIRTTDPRYVNLIQEQNKIGEDLKMIEDSLIALSKRQMQIESFVTREMSDINSNLAKAVQNLVDRRVNEGASRQQFVMTHVNNLALLLSESLDNMVSQMQGASGSCPSSGCSSEGDQNGFKSLKEMQEALNQMLQDMKDGKQPQGSQGQSLSEQLARAAAQQQAIRNHLRQMAEELRQQGLDGQRELEQLQQDMEQTEADIVNRQITDRTIMRQQDILTRLLEHERAERERELDEQRESQQAKNQKFSNPADFFEYKRIKQKEEELLKTVPPSFSIFYRNKVNEYFYKFQD